METQQDAAPDFVIEVNRYPSDDVFRFFFFQPDTGNAIQLSAVAGYDVTFYDRPYGEQGPFYGEVGRKQVSIPEAEVTRQTMLLMGYHPMAFEDVEPTLRDWAAHNHCPIEFHDGLDNLHPEVTKRVTIWLRPWA